MHSTETTVESTARTVVGLTVLDDHVESCADAELRAVAGGASPPDWASPPLSANWEVPLCFSMAVTQRLEKARWFWFHDELPPDLVERSAVRRVERTGRGARTVAHLRSLRLVG